MIENTLDKTDWEHHDESDLEDGLTLKLKLTSMTKAEYDRINENTD